MSTAGWDGLLGWAIVAVILLTALAGRFHYISSKMTNLCCFALNGAWAVERVGVYGLSPRHLSFPVLFMALNYWAYRVSDDDDDDDHKRRRLVARVKSHLPKPTVRRAPVTEGGGGRE